MLREEVLFWSRIMEAQGFECRVWSTRGKVHVKYWHPAERWTLHHYSEKRR